LLKSLQDCVELRTRLRRGGLLDRLRLGLLVNRGGLLVGLGRLLISSVFGRRLRL
jgi:hypothetical protein